MLSRVELAIRCNVVYTSVFRRTLHYVQGQEPEPKVREYFYFVDHQGQLFLDDVKIKNFTSCFKDKKFLQFFFTHLEYNKLARYSEHFPYLSLCGRERNFVRCDDVPIVFTEILSSSSTQSPSSRVLASQLQELSTKFHINPDLTDRLSYCMAGELLTFPMIPTEICMLAASGRIYHPAVERCGGVGLIKSSIAIELSKSFEFRHGESSPPTHFKWRGKTYTLTNSIIAKLEELRALGPPPSTSSVSS